VSLDYCRGFGRLEGRCPRVVTRMGGVALCPVCRKARDLHEKYRVAHVTQIKAWERRQARRRAEKRP